MRLFGLSLFITVYESIGLSLKEGRAGTQGGSWRQELKAETKKELCFFTHSQALLSHLS